MGCEHVWPGAAVRWDFALEPATEWMRRFAINVPLVRPRPQQHSTPAAQSLSCGRSGEVFRDTLPLSNRSLSMPRGKRFKAKEQPRPLACFVCVRGLRSKCFVVWVVIPHFYVRAPGACIRGLSGGAMIQCRLLLRRKPKPNTSRHGCWWATVALVNGMACRGKSFLPSWGLLQHAGASAATCSLQNAQRGGK